MTMINKYFVSISILKKPLSSRHPFTYSSIHDIHLFIIKNNASMISMEPSIRPSMTSTHSFIKSSHPFIHALMHPLAAH